MGFSPPCIVDLGHFPRGKTTLNTWLLPVGVKFLAQSNAEAVAICSVLIVKNFHHHLLLTVPTMPTSCNAVTHFQLLSTLTIINQALHYQPVIRPPKITYR